MLYFIQFKRTGKKDIENMDEDAKRKAVKDDMIKLENVSKVYGKGESEFYALRDINIEIKDGKICGVIGLSGAGKSTLVRCINLLERPTEGRVCLNDNELTALSGKELRAARKKIGMIFQQFQLFDSRTVYENVAFPLRYTGLKKQEIDEKVKRLLKLVDLADREGSYPSELSGGQKQRVAIARALASDPEVLLSDEATSALDPQNTRSILKLLKKLNTELGITVVVITHEMDVIKEICDDVAVMENGRIVEYGDVFSIFAAPQSPVTKNFVESTANLSKIYELIENDDPLVKLEPGQSIVRFSYRQKTSAEALVSYISRKWNLNINIIFGNIEVVADSPIGGLVSIISGAADDVAAAMEYLRSINVGVEVIKDGRASV